MSAEAFTLPEPVSPEEAAAGAEELAAEQRAQQEALLAKRVNEHLWEMRAKDEAKRRYAAERAAEQRRPLVLGSVAELSELPAPEADRVQHLIPALGSTLVVAQAGVGKTTLVMNLCKALLDGTAFLDFCKVSKLAGTVALLSYEMSLHTLVGWAERVGVDPDRLVIVDLRGHSNPLADPEGRAELAGALRERGVEVVIVDTFTRAFTGDSENDTAQVARFLNDLARFTREEVGASELVLTAHAGWNADRARGSSGLYDWPDSIVRLTKAGDGRRYIDTVKVRDGEGLPTHVLDYDPGTHRLTIGEQGTAKTFAAVDKAAEWCPKVAQAVAEAGGSITGFKDLKTACRALGWTGHDRVLRDAAHRAESAGYLTIKDSAGGATVYEIATPVDPGTGPVVPTSQHENGTPVDPGTGPVVPTPQHHPGTPVTPGIYTGVRYGGEGPEVDAGSPAEPPTEVPPATGVQHPPTEVPPATGVPTPAEVKAPGGPFTPEQLDALLNGDTIT